jgi:tryptophan aminotransferase
MITYKLLHSWGYEGFKIHTESVSAFYREKRDIFERAMRTHLTGLAEWTTPEAGMFVWCVLAGATCAYVISFMDLMHRFKLLLSDDPLEEGDSYSTILTTGVERGVLALPGTVFLPNGRKTAYVRASFSLIPEKDVDEAIKRLREAVLAARASKA